LRTQASRMPFASSSCCRCARSFPQRQNHLERGIVWRLKCMCRTRWNKVACGGVGWWEGTRLPELVRLLAAHASPGPTQTKDDGGAGRPQLGRRSNLSRRRGWGAAREDGAEGDGGQAGHIWFLLSVVGAGAAASVTHSRRLLHAWTWRSAVHWSSGAGVNLLQRRALVARSVPASGLRAREPLIIDCHILDTVYLCKPERKYEDPPRGRKRQVCSGASKWALERGS
jgi:hypothetical protein